jgi:hypothetical protein
MRHALPNITPFAPFDGLPALNKVDQAMVRRRLDRARIVFDRRAARWDAWDAASISDESCTGLRMRACDLAAFLTQIASMRQEIDCKMQSNYS